MTTYAEQLLALATETREDVATLTRLAEILAAPKSSEEVSFLQTIVDTQSRVVDGLAQVQASVAALHQAILEPGVAAALKKAISED
jgi:hypothetical protein